MARSYSGRNRSARWAIENSSARRAPSPPAGPGARGRRAGARSASRERVGVARRDEERLAVGPGRRCGSRRCRRPPAAVPRRHRLEQHHAERLAVDGREAGDGRAAQPGLLLLLGDPTQPLARAGRRGRGAQSLSRARRRSPRGRRRGRARRTRRAAPRGPCAARGGRRRRSRARRRRRCAPRRARARRPRWAGSRTRSRTSAQIWRLASSDTAVATASRRIIGLRPGRNVSYQPLRPVRGEWNVPTAGMRGADERGVVGAGRERLVQVQRRRVGSVRRASIVRRATARPVAMGATEPLLGTRELGPTVVIARLGRRAVARGRRCGRRRRASRSARASPSTWPCTPPNSVREYGHDSMTLIDTDSIMLHPHGRGRWASWAAAGASAWVRPGSAPRRRGRGPG